MIWNDRMIREWAANGGVTPFDEAMVNPASIDLRLGNNIRIPRQHWQFLSGGEIGKRTPASELWQESQLFDKFILWPGHLVLCHSV